MADRPATAALFDAAVDATHHAFGSACAPKLIHIITVSGFELSISVPPQWQPLVEVTPLKASPECVAEVLATIVQAGRRLTRAALMDEMQRLNRKRAESTVCMALEDLTRVGVVDNRQDAAASGKGYGVRGWD